MRQDFPPSAEFPTLREISHLLRNFPPSAIPSGSYSSAATTWPSHCLPIPTDGSLTRLSLLAPSSAKARAVGILYFKQTVTSEDVFKFKEFNYSITVIVFSWLL